ncbi:uncharacterized protein LOC126899666 isoform X2 [Daktulosphaira vitifoliae]|uniref:uncharacterized protein LOC126899666 isoform X2 n=1 Tax=Daktulosphaira vitifoliae TaxID=58002 RepID=UPI0021A9F2F1|nr:uncharacterized protein LOC126899666 isoform X2 [Daktulosphaira vitifoliae]
MAHVIHASNESVPSKVPVSAHSMVPHFSVINKTGSAGCSEESNLNVPNNQHVFKPIISPRPSILRKRDADGVLKAQKNLIPILTKPEPEDCITEESMPSRNGYNETTICHDELLTAPQVSEVVLPRIAALQRTQSQLMVEISPRKKPRKQLLPVNQNSPFKIVGDEMEYVEDKVIKHNKNEFPDDDVLDCNDDCGDGDAEDELEDELDDNDMDVDDDCPADDDYDENDEDDTVFGNDFDNGFDYVKADKTYFEDGKISTDLSDGSSTYNPTNKRPTLLGRLKNSWRGQSHHFQKHSDFKVKENKKQLAEIQQAKKWAPDSRSGWRVRHLLKQFDGMVKIEDDVIERMTDLLQLIEHECNDLNLRDDIVELIKDNIQRSRVTRDQLEEVSRHLSKIFDYKTLIEDVVDKFCPKELKKKCPKVFSKV